MAGTASVLKSASRLMLGKRVGDAAGPAPGGAVIQLGGQDFGEVGQVGLVFPGGDLGQAGGLVADGEQLEFAGRGADGGLGGGVGHGGHGMVLVSSWS